MPRFKKKEGKEKPLQLRSQEGKQRETDLPEKEGKRKRGAGAEEEDAEGIVVRREKKKPETKKGKADLIALRNLLDLLLRDPHLRGDLANQKDHLHQGKAGGGLDLSRHLHIPGGPVERIREL